MTLETRTLGGDEGILFTGLTYNRYKHLVKYEEANRDAFFSTGGWLDGIPAGLALCEQVSSEQIELRSLFVLPKYRNQGIATVLLASAEKEAIKRGCKTFSILFQDQGKGAEIMPHLLDRSGYSPPQFSALICRSLNQGKILTAPFLKKSLLPPSCELFLWRTLSRKERDIIKDKQKKTPWYPELLSPFSNEEEIEYLNSLGLRYRGEIAGWVITHRISKKTIRYTTSFVREDLQQYGFAAPLLIEAIKLHLSSPESTVATDASFIIPAQFGGMIAFAKKRMLPYMEEIANLYMCSKNLPIP